MQIPRYFYYITHRDNLKSILKNGILSRSHLIAELMVRVGYIEKKGAEHKK